MSAGSSPLADEIGRMIALDGPIGLDRFMSLALGHPRYGYYITRDPFGLGGDFVTAPEISQMFGELMGLWAAEVWAGMGMPAAINLVELGPGRGTLMADALRAVQIVEPFARAITVHLVETSPVLRARQRDTLADCGYRVIWHQRIEDVPSGPAVFIANEFFDALPVRHYVRTERGWCERLIGIDEYSGAGRTFRFGLSPEPEPHIRAEAGLGTILEIGAEGHSFMADLARRIAGDGGALLAIDYGHTQTAFGETLQAMQHHLKVDPLDDPGEADLTAHVDFASLKRAALASGAQCFGPVQQGDFLTSLGIFERAAGLKRRADPRQSVDIDRALLRLVSKGREMGVDGRMAPSMGALFKVLAVGAPGLPQPPGFESAPEGGV